MKKIVALAFLTYFSFVSVSFAQDFDDGFEDDDFAAFESAFDSKKEDTAVYDPIEPVNRAVYAFNDKADKYLINPVVKRYHRYAPQRVRRSVHNFTTNLTLPLSFVNSLAQGKVDNALATLSTFLINTTIGVFGIFDVAGSKKIEYSQEDLGQTLAFYGVPPGPYLMLPILGPSNLRDTVGRGGDSAIDFLGFNMLEIGGSDQNVIDDDTRVVSFFITGLDKRDQLIGVIDDIRKDSFDPYVTVRSFYSQNRESEIKK